MTLLPEGRQLAVTWGIPDAFGGMTTALLHRSRAFVRLAGSPVDVLTFDPRPGLPTVRRRLERDGHLVDGVALRNLYDDLRERTPPPGALRHEPPAPASGARPGRGSVVAPDGTELRVLRDGGDGEDRGDGAVVRLEHRRADGSVAAIDERRRPDGPRRLITAFDADERPVRQWAGAWQCYADWIDGIVGDEPAFAIVDSKTMAPLMAELRRPNLVTMHVVHNAHLVGSARPLGVVRPSRRSVLSRMERFDAVVFLTGRQRADAATLLSDPGNLEVIPNGCTLPPDAHPDSAPRDPAACVVVAGLTARKRVHHAIEVVRMLRDSGVPARLAVHGDGPELPRLQAAAREAGVAGHVDFAGYRPDAAQAFAAASATLLTSTSEGAPLVLLEAMARGCIPVAYDIAYGPADVIVDGVNGFLVPPGDLRAAAERILRIVELPESERERMRSAARATAARFNDVAVTTAWGVAQRAAQSRHERSRVEVELACRLDRLRVRRPATTLRLTAQLAGVSEAARVTVRLEQPASGALLRRAVAVRSDRIALRLTPAETELLGRGRLRIGFDVADGPGVARLDGGTLHPDTRRLPRRAVQAARRVGTMRPSAR